MWLKQPPRQLGAGQVPGTHHTVQGTKGGHTGLKRACSSLFVRESERDYESHGAHCGTVYPHVHGLGVTYCTFDRHANSGWDLSSICQKEVKMAIIDDY